MLDHNALSDAMRRALDLARRSPAGNTNPQVGCVILDPTASIIAEGWHLGAGTPHAEVAALAKLPTEWRSRSDELTAVVTLEPCNHTGRTGPCAQALIDAGIGQVAYSLNDPGALSGGGAATLRTAGVQVLGGILEAESQALLTPWLNSVTGSDTVSNTHASQANTNPGTVATSARALRPIIIVKWAQTLDGRAAAADGTSQWITGPEARADVHTRRAAADAILVGIGTVLADNPSLTARASDGTLLATPAQQPLPVVFGKRAIPADASIRAHPALTHRNITDPLQFSGTDFAAHFAALSEQGIRTVFVEGGPTLASSLIAQGFADRALVYVAPTLLGGPKLALGDLGKQNIADICRLTDTKLTQLGSDILIEASIDTRERPAHQQQAAVPQEEI